MNPLNWRREHQVALLLGGVIGIAMGLLIGYMYDTLWSMYDGILTAMGNMIAAGKSAATANAPVNPPNLPRAAGQWLGSGSSFRWGVCGALVGGAILYTRQLLHA
jgi:hypothetical protein